MLRSPCLTTNFRFTEFSEVHLERVYLERKCINALPLAPRQSIHVQPGQRSGTTRAPSLQSLQLVEALVEEPGEVSLVARDLLQGLIVWQQALSTHPCQILLYSLCGRLGADNV